MQTIKVVSGKVHQTKFGAFPHDDFIGKEFGTKVKLMSVCHSSDLLSPKSELNTMDVFVNPHYI